MPERNKKIEEHGTAGSPDYQVAPDGTATTTNESPNVVLGATADPPSEVTVAGLQIGLSPAILGPFSGYRAKLFTRVILGPAQRNYIEKGTLPPKSAPQNKIGLKFLLQNVEIFRRQPSPVSIGLSPIFSPDSKVHACLTLKNCLE